MAVYVDNVRHAFGRMVMCHMWADSLDELHNMASRIGIARKWFQNPETMPKVSWCHYDISLSKKAEAIRLGAILTDKYGPSYFEALRKGDARMVGMVIHCRESFGLPLDGIIR